MTNPCGYACFALLTTLATLGLLEAKRRGSRRGEWILKPLAAAGFIGAALAAHALETRFGAAIFLGLCFSFAGDVLLIPRTRSTFVLGLVAFLLGHVAYGCAFVVRGISPLSTLVAGAAAVVPAVMVMRWLLPNVEARMKPAIVAYVVVISAMVAIAVGTVAARGNPLIVIGALAFYLSDLAVARDRFVAQEFANKVWGWPLYFGAQLVLAFCAGSATS
jgi:uncharacterized membrane protein YhhN